MRPIEHSKAPERMAAAQPPSAILSSRRSVDWNKRHIIELALLLVACAMPLLVDDYVAVFLTRVLILCIFALSFDLVWGYSGILSLGQSLFFGLAGYGVAILSRDYGLSSAILALPFGALLGFASSALIAAFLLIGSKPTSAIFVSLGTMTGAYVADRFARGSDFLGGQNGIPSVQIMTIGPWEVVEGTTFFYLSLGLLVLVYAACAFLTRSQFGLALVGLRENERRISFLGYRVQYLKIIVFSFAGAIAGLSGGLYAFHEGYVGTNIIGVVFSTQAVLYVLFGGPGTLVGAIIGTVAIEIMSFYLSNSFQDEWPIILGVILLLVIMFRPAGMISLVLNERERIGSFARFKKRGSP